ncbi:hypothetical protein [Vibrio anguillarum]|uniref:Uncharacterized protein n=1 Tax=Vibrio anguillarum TaxID=55601 RepID=A0A7U6FS24_VIBAN|nr:hypothetical protein [Vibrio anguillarum]AZS26277.1 hypothetical protein DYL72_15320 [Vibrio anguillarum]MBF4374558.1 hypothetical protein [Vibrio anguillarum]
MKHIIKQLTQLHLDACGKIETEQNKVNYNAGKAYAFKHAASLLSEEVVIFKLVKNLTKPTYQGVETLGHFFDLDDAKVIMHDNVENHLSIGFSVEFDDDRMGVELFREDRPNETLTFRIDTITVQ